MCACDHNLPNCFAQLVNENKDGVALVEVGSELAQCLAHQTCLQAHVAVAHFAFDFGAGYAASWARDTRLVELSGKTVEEELAAGVETVEVWRAVWAHEGLPARER